MAPIRRYLRITKYSVLECRIYLDNPALAYSWLLNPRDPVLPRVIESVRPLVLPKLREEKERERTKKKSSKKKAIKDTIATDEFEVAIFLPETNTRHSLLYKHKHFRDKTQTKLTSNSTKLTGSSREAPIELEGERELYHPGSSVLIREEEDDDDNEANILDDIPSINPDETSSRRSKRRRSSEHPEPEPVTDEDDSFDEDDDLEVDIADIHTGLTDDESDDDLFVSQRPSKRQKSAQPPPSPQPDDKKKMAMEISYEGFAIYGRVLCLVVKRKGGGGTLGAVGGVGNKQTATQLGGQAMMESWITATQMPPAEAAEVEMGEEGEGQA